MAQEPDAPLHLPAGFRMLLALLERGIIDRERAGLALADVPAQRCRLAPGHPVARTIALGIAERPQIECIDALIRRSAMTHRPPPCPVRTPGPRPWREIGRESCRARVCQ